ncbi:MAG TPA: minor capsid protein [Jiangellaceae bacterium]|nr:minor capsid protein [Jiangellaceae bacterium]
MAIRVTQVRRGLAEWIGLNVPGAVWSETSPYGPDDRAVALRDLPSQPDTAVAVEVYNTDDDLVLPNTEVRVQLLFRGRGDAGDEFGDDVFDALHGRHRFEFPNGLKVQRAARLYAAPLGVDDNQRERRSDNYGLVFMRP